MMSYLLWNTTGSTPKKIKMNTHFNLKKTYRSKIDKPVSYRYTKKVFLIGYIQILDKPLEYLNLNLKPLGNSSYSYNTKNTR